MVKLLPLLLLISCTTKNTKTVMEDQCERETRLRSELGLPESFLCTKVKEKDEKVAYYE